MIVKSSKPVAEWQPMTTESRAERARGLKVGVLGAGALGKEHARIYAELAAKGQVDFLGVYDVSAETARQIAGNNTQFITAWTTTVNCCA